MTGENSMLPASDACERNKGPILEVLRRAFAERSHVLEIGSGTGQHAVYFAAHLPHLVWQPSERLAHMATLDARVRRQGSGNLRAPAVLDVGQKIWAVRSVDAVFSANTLHSMPWDDVQPMYAGIDAVLAASGVLCIYGPFRHNGEHIAASNERFDAELRERDPRSGIRDFEAVRELAASHRLRLAADHALPANNRLLEFVRTD